jgi:hypothetical protein
MAKAPEDNSRTAADLGEIENPAFKHDVDLSDRYQAFSAEMLRLSLAGIAGIGFLIAIILPNTLPKDPNLPTQRVALSVTAPSFSAFASASLFCLGLSSAASLAHRYFATDSLACHIKALRLLLRGRPDDAEKVRQEKEYRKRKFDQSRRSLLAASIFLGLGAILLAMAFVVGLLYS